MNDHPIIGFYCPNDDIFPVYYDAISGEMYYIDEQGCAYMITGFELQASVAANLSQTDIEGMCDEAPEDIIGCVVDGDTKVMLSIDNSYYRVGADATDTADAIETGEYEDDMEYEIEEDGEDE